MYIRSMMIWSMIVAAFWMGGCATGSSIENKDDFTIISSSNQESGGVKTLSLESADLQQFLMNQSWKGIAINLSVFYANDNYPKKRNYMIDLRFKNKEVIAYADCQKITARYQVLSKEISFSHLSIAPALELATCEEVEYADSALWVFLENRFVVKEITKEHVLFEAVDVDSDVLLFQEK